MSITILAIESSCDDTSASIIQDGNVLSNIVSTQEVHQKYGGVIPELASRAHQQNIIPVVHQALAQAKVQKNEVNAVAFTRGPGLLGSLLIGTSFAKSFALGMDIPLVEVNHMEAHILAHFAEDPKPKFPFLCLTVSGGHTQLVLVESHLKMQVLGETIDDAVGEAFDKTAKLLGLPYPGGPLIDKYAKEGNPKAFQFGEVKSKELNFSFSGVKTSILYFLKKQLKENENFIEENLHDICASVQHTLIEILMKQLKKAVEQTGVTRVAIAGGVSANSGLRNRLQELSTSLDWDVFIPAFQYCTDNAGMIAVAGYYKYLEGEFVGQEVSPNPRLKI
ncbi:MAG: tRNA (adenosine(37)-N6)-threonylcarbamoyltransferase complex transferase subunit TsaD [Cytophagales bacterium]|nr:tRNA (adenosine(37)-N6)-threonylcarbamoyltransferase complex transferase subunit TsaD [Cytophagales bacterium]